MDLESYPFFLFYLISSQWNSDIPQIEKCAVIYNIRDNCPSARVHAYFVQTQTFIYMFISLFTDYIPFWDLGSIMSVVW